MTSFQIVSLVVLVGVAAWTYVPRIAIPVGNWKAGKPSTMKHIQQVMAIRDSSQEPSVIEACNVLLQCLLK
jgi:hypothetical protein